MDTDALGLAKPRDQVLFRVMVRCVVEDENAAISRESLHDGGHLAEEMEHEEVHHRVQIVGSQIKGQGKQPLATNRTDSIVALAVDQREKLAATHPPVMGVQGLERRGAAREGGQEGRRGEGGSGGRMEKERQR